MNRIIEVKEIVIEIDEETYDTATYGEEMSKHKMCFVLKDKFNLELTDVLKCKYLGQDWRTNDRSYIVKYY